MRKMKTIEVPRVDNLYEQKPLGAKGILSVHSSLSSFLNAEEQSMHKQNISTYRVQTTEKVQNKNISLSTESQDEGWCFFPNL